MSGSVALADQCAQPLPAAGRSQSVPICAVTPSWRPPVSGMQGSRRTRVPRLSRVADLLKRQRSGLQTPFLLSNSPDHVAVRFREAACAASSARVVMPSSAKMWVRCTLTVPGVMNSRRAMASLRRPSLTRRTTSRSAGVRRGQAGPAGGGAFAAAALAGGVGDCVVEGESLAFFLCLGEPVLPEGVPGLAGGAGGRVAVGGEAGGQVLQRL